MPSDRKFYRTMVHVEVLSEKPLDMEPELQDLVTLAEADDGVSLATTWDEPVPVDGPTMADLLMKQDNDPEFFGLTEEGEDYDD